MKFLKLGIFCMAFPLFTTLSYAGSTTLQWDSVEGAAQYVVQIKDGTKYIDLAFTTGTHHNLVIPNDNKLYCYRVRAINVAGIRSGYSRTLCLAEPLLAPNFTNR